MEDPAVPKMKAEEQKMEGKDSSEKCQQVSNKLYNVTPQKFRNTFLF
jgi:hypothetical protein